MRPPQVALLGVILMLLFHFWFPVFQWIVFPFTLFGIVLFIAGLLFSLWARNWFKKKNTSLRPIKKPEHLQTMGPFSFSRNPMYLGTGFGLLGCAIFLGSAGSLVGPLVFFLAMNYGFVPFEERFLEKHFGLRYLEYERKVRRWL